MGHFWFTGYCENSLWRALTDSGTKNSLAWKSQGQCLEVIIVLGFAWWIEIQALFKEIVLSVFCEKKSTFLFHFMEFYCKNLTERDIIQCI